MRAACRKPSEAAPGRLGALARLPVFLDLAAKPALVAGGSPAAAWKAELLAAAGAAVAVHAFDPGRDMLALVGRGAAAGSITLHRSAWTAAAFAGAAIAGGFVVAFSEVAITYPWLKVAGYLFPGWEPGGLLQLLGTEYKFAVSFVILIVVLLFKPTGLFRGKSV